MNIQLFTESSTVEYTQNSKYVKTFRVRLKKQQNNDICYKNQFRLRLSFLFSNPNSRLRFSKPVLILRVSCPKFSEKIPLFPFILSQRALRMQKMRNKDNNMYISIISIYVNYYKP